METTKCGSIRVTISVPVQVQYRVTSGVPFDVRIGGLVRMYDLMPEDVRIQINEQIIAEERRHED